MDSYGKLVEEDGLKEVESIKIGDTLFVRLQDVTYWGLDDDDVLLADNDCITYKDSVRKNIDYNFLIAVKYLGNGIFQEMTTGEKIISGGFDKSRYEDENKSVNLIFPVEYDNFAIKKGINNPEQGIDEYIKCCSNYKNLQKYFPLLVLLDISKHENDGLSSLIEIDEKSKKQYLEYSDDERRSIISKLIEEARISYDEACKEIDSQLSKINVNYEPLTKETEEIAYLENDLYDFKKGKGSR